VKSRQISLTDVAVSDILEQAAWYQEKSGTKLAQRWEQAVSSILLRVAKNPAAGAPCSFKAVELKGVRRMTVPRFSRHLMFYQVHDQEVVVLRIVHGARDLETLF